ncbi:MAG: glutamate--tRNA ligase, partial [Rickettsiales bacterium]|nr:glutamate--tRNA ligase [Rickettsiales bacterium]
AQYEAEGKTPHWRFKLREGEIRWQDEIHGEMQFEGANLSDPILIRENGLYTYMLPSAVDDVELGVTHVLRGEDHISNTAIQIQLFEALGGDIPNFAHNALIKTREGKLSKRKGDSAIHHLREKGIEPMTIASFLAKLGSSDPIEPQKSLQTLIDSFDIQKFSRSSTLYDMEDLDRLNPKILHLYDFSDVEVRLQELGLTRVDVEFWEAVKGNIETLAEVVEWWRICKEPLTPEIEDAAFARDAAALLPEGPWTAETWGHWVESIKAQTGRKGKALFMPLRKALTGMEHGPELKVMLPLIGRERALARLNGQTA